jgi:hypothetical protein
MESKISKTRAELSGFEVAWPCKQIVDKRCGLRRLQTGSERRRNWGPAPNSSVSAIADKFGVIANTRLTTQVRTRLSTMTQANEERRLPPPHAEPGGLRAVARSDYGDGEQR